MDLPFSSPLLLCVIVVQVVGAATEGKMHFGISIKVYLEKVYKNTQFIEIPKLQDRKGKQNWSTRGLKKYIELYILNFKDLPDLHRFQTNYENLWFCSPKLNVHDIGGWMYWVTFLIADRLLVAQSVRADRAAESSQNCPELEILKMLSEIYTFLILYFHCTSWL